MVNELMSARTIGIMSRFIGIRMSAFIYRSCLRDGCDSTEHKCKQRHVVIMCQGYIIGVRRYYIKSTTCLRTDARSWERVCGWLSSMFRWKGPGGSNTAGCAMMHDVIMSIRIANDCRRIPLLLIQQELLLLLVIR